MAVPKKRTGHSAQGSRRANWKATKPETTKCPNCGETVLTLTNPVLKPDVKAANKNSFPYTYMN